MVHTYKIEGLIIQTGDLICTTDGGDADVTGQFWRFIGKLIPGDVDHIVVYVGPEVYKSTSSRTVSIPSVMMITPPLSSSVLSVPVPSV